MKGSRGRGVKGPRRKNYISPEVLFNTPLRGAGGEKTTILNSKF
jgi:hypothetical protein